MLLGLSFDLWDTLVSDSPQGRLGKRRHYGELLRLYGGIETDSGDDFHRALSVEEAGRGRETRGISLEERARIIFADLCGPAGGAGNLARAMSEASLQHPPDVGPGVIAMLRNLSAWLPVKIITNTRWTSGAAARSIISISGLGAYIEDVISSDETAWAKPSPYIFQAAWGPHVDPARTVHVGDSVKRDHVGARLFGGRSVLSRVLRDVREPGETEADAICWNYEDLPLLLEYLDGADPEDGWELLGKGHRAGGTVVTGTVRAGLEPGSALPHESVAIARELPSNQHPLPTSIVAILVDSHALAGSAATIARNSDTTFMVCPDEILVRLSDGDRVLIDGNRGAIWRYR